MSGHDIFHMPVLELGMVETFKAGSDVGEASEHDAVIFIGDGDFTDASFSIDCFEAQKIAEHIVMASNSHAALVAERDALREVLTLWRETNGNKRDGAWWDNWYAKFDAALSPDASQREEG